MPTQWLKANNLSTEMVAGDAGQENEAGWDPGAGYGEQCITEKGGWG